MHTLSKLRTLIRITLKSEKGDTYYVGECPLCDFTSNATIIDSRKYAKVSAVGSVVSHLKLEHKGEIENNEKDNA